MAKAAAAAPVGSPSKANGSASHAPQKQSSTAESSKQPHTQHFEFFGPHGPALLVLVLPAVCYGLIFACNRDFCASIYPELRLPSLSSLSSLKLYTHEAMAVYLAWFFGLALLHLLLPGKKAQGVLLPNGSRLNYKLNCERGEGGDCGGGWRRGGCGARENGNWGSVEAAFGTAGWGTSLHG